MTNITTLRPGDHFMFKNFEWVCLDPNHPDGGVLAIMAKPWAEDVKFCPSGKFADEKGNWNNYRTSNVRGILSDMATRREEKNEHDNRMPYPRRKPADFKSLQHLPLVGRI